MTFDSQNCKLCFKKFGDQSRDKEIHHHISYFPEITISLCSECHQIGNANKVLLESFWQYDRCELHRFYNTLEDYVSKQICWYFYRIDTILKHKLWNKKWTIPIPDAFLRW